MLNQDALAQLKSLKKDIHDSIPRHEGKVRGTSGRFGFVNTEDNQQFFLSPDEMDKVLPGDTIKFRVEDTKDGKKQAIVEKLVSSEQDFFVGQYLIKGKGHFVSPDHPSLNRWIFIPPAKRQNAKDGQLVACKVSKHPYPHGKAQADIVEVLGDASERQIESNLMIRKWGLASTFSEDCQNEASALLSVMEEATSTEERSDQTGTEWLTIDSAGSRDLDDALYCETQDKGWKLQVAIADPSCAIKPGSEIDQEAARRATSSYFADQMLPMMPSELSEGAFSLLPGQKRPAMVCELTVTEQGEIENFSVANAFIESKAKLNYIQVQAFFDGEEKSDVETPLTDSLKETLNNLNACATALLARRKEQHLVLDDKPEFRMQLNEQGKIDQLVPVQRTQAHRLVEECMVAVNRSIAGFLAEQENGLYIQHAGIRTERLGEARALVKERLGIEKPEEISTLEGFIDMQKRAAADESELPMSAILARQLERSKYSTEAKPHMGMGLSCYTTFTSPIRKYNDLLVHRLVKAALAGQSSEAIPAEQLEAMGEAQNNVRMATWQAEQWLKAEWLQRQLKDETIKGPQKGHIVQVNSAGFTVRLDDNGVEGLFETRRNKDWKFDTKTLTHTHKKGEEETTYRLDQSVEVLIDKVNPVNREVKLILA
jgi:exoribonuclease-2/ribonuclease R